MQTIWIVIAGLLGTLIGAVAAYALLAPRIKRAEADVAGTAKRAEESDKARQALEVELATVRAEANRATGIAGALREREIEVAELKRQAADLAATVRERERALAEEREQFATLKGEFKAQFAELSATALKHNSEAFLDSAKRVLELQRQTAETDLDQRKAEISQLVKPLQDGIVAVSTAAAEMEKRREHAFGTIAEQLRQSVEQAAEVARQTSGLKDALKRPNVRGRWGEVQLKNCVELAGMEEHCDVEFQDTSLSPDDALVRPDMTVRMPGGRRISVDAKTPMDPFLEHIDATTDEARNAALIRHGRAVRAHVAALATRDYMKNVANSPDFVVMFLPNESFLAMALEKESSIMEEALNKKVLITTPGTLIGLLKVVRYGWTEQKIAENAQRISDEGAKLNTELTRFLEEFARLGRAIKSASELFDGTSRRVERQIAGSSARLDQLGARSRVQLSPAAVRMLLPGDASDLQLDMTDDAI